LKKYIENILGSKIPEKDWSLLQGITESEEIEKGTLLIIEGRVCKKIWFLKRGAVRYYENIDGEIRTTHFFIAPSMFTVYHSLITGSPSVISVEAVEALHLEWIPYDKLKGLYNKSHMLERIGRIMAEYQFIAEFNRRRMLLNMDALERYEFLEKEQPEIFQYFQLKDIATFLGITPVSLSRLRKYRLSRK